MTHAELTRRFRQLGCLLARQGSRHEIWESPANGRTAAVPRHAHQEIPLGTLRKILSELGLEPSEFTR